MSQDLSLIHICRQANRDCITAESYDEFVRIKDRVRFDSKDAIIGRQDLRILGSWEFGTKSVVEYLFRKEDFDKYHAVYVICLLYTSRCV